MRRFLIFQALLLTALFFISQAAFSFPRSQSYRSSGTAGLFKSNYDKLSGNPALVGSSIKFIDYYKMNRAEGQKQKENEIFSTLDGLNTDGRFLLGAMQSLGFLGIGGFVELGYDRDPNYCGYSKGIGNTSVSFSDSGSVEGSDVYLHDDGTGVYDYKDSLYMEQQHYTTDRHLNANLTVGGLAAGPLVFGLSVVRNTDGSDLTENEGGYNYTRTRLSDSYNTYTENGSFDYNSEVDTVQYNTTLGMVLGLGGAVRLNFCWGLTCLIMSG